MAIRKRAEGIYHYRFQVAGREVSGSCGTADRREAERIEAKAQREAQAISLRAPAAGANLKFGEALTLFWNEVATNYSNGDPKGTYRQTVWGALEWLRHESHIGEKRPLRDITPGMIEQAIGRRRADGVCNATINRTVTEILRRIFLRARAFWDVPVGHIEWKKHMRPEPKERIRALASHEEKDLMAAIPLDYAPVIAFMLKSGFRVNEAVNLRQRDIDWQRGRIAVIGKGNKPSSIPLSGELRAILAPLRAPTEWVFHYTAQRTRDGRIKGERYPVTDRGLDTAWRRYARPLLVDFRLHDLRHTAATRLGRHANIRVVQRFMRHEDIATTAKYMHAFDADVLAAMEAESQGAR